MKFIKILLLVSLFFLQKHTFAFSIKKEEIKNFKIISDLEKEKTILSYKIDVTGNLSEGLRYNNLLKYNDALTKITYEYYK